MWCNYKSFLEKLPQNPAVTQPSKAVGTFWWPSGWARLDTVAGRGIFSPARVVAVAWGGNPCPPAGASPFGHKQYFIGKQGVGDQRVTGKGDQVLPERRNAQNCLFRKESNLWSGITWGILRMKRRVQIPISAGRAWWYLGLGELTIVQFLLQAIVSTKVINLHISDEQC